MNEAENTLLIDMLQECFEEEILHLRLRQIREIQKVRFDAIAEEQPAIKKTFLEARKHHDRLLLIRRQRQGVLTAMIEEPILFNYVIEFKSDLKIPKGTKLPIGKWKHPTGSTIQVGGSPSQEEEIAAVLAEAKKRKRKK